MVDQRKSSQNPAAPRSFSSCILLVLRDPIEPLSGANLGGFKVFDNPDDAKLGGHVETKVLQAFHPSFELCSPLFIEPAFEKHMDMDDEEVSLAVIQRRGISILVVDYWLRKLDTKAYGN